MTLLILIRHGQCVTNKYGFLSGDPDRYELTKSGLVQAQATAEELSKTLKVSKIYSSPVFRARQTAGIIAKKLNKEVIVDDRLKERLWGAMEGKPSRQGAWRFHMTKDESATVETWQSITARMVSFAKDVSKEDGVIIGVSHVDPIASFACDLFKIKDDELSVYCFVPPFASMSLFGYKDHTYKVLATGMSILPKQVMDMASPYLKK